MSHDIVIRGARVHNLNNINLEIPRDKLVVLTGLSGSGKTSLAFDTIYAEGQRRYVESLSSYARQFLGQMEKPDVDSIEGLSPAISIDQKTTSKNPRSTVGTVTEIYDYLRLLYARAGSPHCPQCGRGISSQTIDQIIDSIMAHPDRTRLQILAPLVSERKGEFRKLLEDLAKQGFIRVRIDGEQRTLDEDIQLDKRYKHSIEVIVDRLVNREGIRSRLADSVETALRLADGVLQVIVEIPEGDEHITHEEMYSQNNSCPHCNISIGEIQPRSFSFNNPLGACPDCTGLGSFRQADEELIISDPDLSLNDGAITASGFNFADKKSWSHAFGRALAKSYDFSMDTPWKDLSAKAKKVILYGTKGKNVTVDTTSTRYNHGKSYSASYEGVVPAMQRRYEEASDGSKEHYEPYMSETICHTCKGARLRPEILAVTYGDLSIDEITHLPIRRSKNYLTENLDSLTPQKQEIARRIVVELQGRLQFLIDVGLDYMTLARSSATLSGGEAQRIRLATQIGSGLMGVLYILDEPSIGLHQRDNRRLLGTLKHLRDLGNTVLVVEHDEETMMNADYIVDMGPGAGEQGGDVVACGTAEEIMQIPESVTGQYLSGKKSIPLPVERREGNGFALSIKGAALNNLKNIDVDVPLGKFTCVTGVSGSGKSSLVNGIILPRLEVLLNRARRKAGPHKALTGAEHLDKVIAIDQSPIGRTPRSNPATYTGVFDMIRQLYSQIPEAKARGYKPGRFSFNVKGGRCEACQGDGVNKIEMHFLADVYVECDVCHGSRYNHETLDVKYRGKSIADILDMTITEALEFFANQQRILRKIQTLDDVGLSYLKLGQPSTQLSGGEAQRVKLATELSKRSTGQTFYILDEPTTGLHIADVHKLIEILQRLTDGGNTVVVIEHNLDVIKTADHIIDLGPEGGDAGGTLVAQGTPEEVADVEESYTGQYLRNMLHMTQTGDHTVWEVREVVKH